MSTNIELIAALNKDIEIITDIIAEKNNIKLGLENQIIDYTNTISQYTGAISDCRITISNYETTISQCNIDTIAYQDNIAKLREIITILEQNN